MEGHYEIIRTAHAAIRIDSPSKATWVDLFLREKLRGKGIGSAIVRIMLDYLKEKGITEVTGKISAVDGGNRGGFRKVSGFWKKNGFAVIPYEPDDRTGWVAKITCVLTCHSNYR
jgi:GNAT superfamily N-acetyltransferase